MYVAATDDENTDWQLVAVTVTDKNNAPVISEQGTISAYEGEG